MQLRIAALQIALHPGVQLPPALVVRRRQRNARRHLQSKAAIWISVISLALFWVKLAVRSNCAGGMNEICEIHLENVFFFSGESHRHNPWMDFQWLETAKTVSTSSLKCFFPSGENKRPC